MNLDKKDDTVVFDDFYPWFEGLIAIIKPDLIIAIARGAVRLLELHRIFSEFTSIGVFSDNALPFISDSEIKGKRILIFDDSVIFGSTMYETREYVHSRGGIPYCASYVIDRRNFLGEGKLQTDQISPSEYSFIPIEYKHKYWPSDIRIHHDYLVRCLLDTLSHYNLDFPTAQISLDTLSSETIPIFINSLKNSLKAEKIEDISSADSSTKGLYRFSALMPTPSNRLFGNEKFVFRPYTKVRITISTSRNTIWVTPIIQLSMDETFNVSERVFSDKILNEYWNNLIKPKREDIKEKQSLFKMVTSLVTTLYLKEIVDLCSLSLIEQFDNFKSVFLNFDIKLTFGKENAEALSEIFNSYSGTQIIDQVDDTSNNVFFRTNIEDQLNSTDDDAQLSLVNKIIKFWKVKPHLRPSKYEVPYEIIGKLFFCLRNVTDNPSIRRDTPGIGRISVGLSFESIMYLINQVCSIDLDKDNISLGVDICVDNGQAVPKVLNYSHRFERYFYSGERAESIDPTQFKHYYHQAYSEYLATRKALPLKPFDLHKLTVVLKDIFPILPISTKYNIYGRYAMPTKIEQELIPWLTKGLNPPFQFDRQKGERNRDLLIPNENYHLTPQIAWNHERERDILDSFQYIATLFSLTTDEHKLLLSTCKTHRHTYNSVAYEAHAWAYKGKFNFSEISELESLDKTEIRNKENEIVNNLYWSIVYVTECLKKYNIFHYNSSVHSSAALKRPSAASLAGYRGSLT